MWADLSARNCCVRNNFILGDAALERAWQPQIFTFQLILLSIELSFLYYKVGSLLEMKYLHFPSYRSSHVIWWHTSAEWKSFT